MHERQVGRVRGEMPCRNAKERPTPAALVGLVGLGLAIDVYKGFCLLNLLCFSLFSGACALTGTLVGFALMRFLGGVFLGVELPLAYAYLSEVLPAKSRGRLCGYAYS